MEQKAKILYIEDNLDTQELIKIFLRPLAEVDCSINAENILQLLSEKNYDLILLDINLPGKIDGTDAIKLIRRDERFKDIPIIAVTAYAMIGDREKFLNMGCNEYIAKPFFKEELINKVKQILNQKLQEKS
ncbi:MAG: response regulator [Ignavibacteria bacterium]|jgi:CheY-like chemotaxis protein|nr:response regulator [Ignavibacteria bacterium]MDH7528468.1 response regulator [Ignavibacteria bacterium]NPV10569.1 response regulator [Ignavibacteria bacterium]